MVLRAVDNVMKEVEVLLVADMVGAPRWSKVT